MRTTGPVVRIAPNQFSFNDPDAIKTIYGIGKPFIKSSWYKASSDPNAQFKDLFTDQNAARHSANRRLVANLYSVTSLRTMESAVDECVDLLVDRMSELSRSGKSFDLQFWMQCYAFDVIGQITASTLVGFLEKGTDERNIFSSLHDYLKYCAVIGVVNELHGVLSWLMSFLPANGIAYVANFTQASIQQGRKIRSMDRSFDKAQDFLSKALSLHQANPDKFPDAAIQTLCLTNFGAGSDTTSISLCATIFSLIKHPECLSKLRNEIDEKLAHLGDVDKIPFKDTQSMPYLQACIKESLRLHPATGLPLARVVPEGGATITGTFFPSGVVVGVNSWVAHRNPDVFGPDTDEFRPERWLTTDKEKLKMMDASWMPFGAGSRTCIGKNISLLEMNKLVPTLVKRFDFSEAASCNVHMENYWLVKQKGMICKVGLRDMGKV
ncbi:hypothetical protein LRP88_12333 [Fusarium phalaenopsidis]